MSKTALDIGLIAGAVALGIFTYGAGDSMFVSLLAPAWASAANASLLFAVSVSAGLTGSFGLLESILNPNDVSVPGAQQNLSNSAAYRRIIYGEVEVGGIVTFDSHPAGNSQFQDVGPTADWRHQVYTLSGHQITGFGKGGQMYVVIDSIVTMLTDIGNGLWVPSDILNPWAGNPPALGVGSNPSYHIAFEFDVGNPATVLEENGGTFGQPFPNLTGACPNWTETCCQAGRAKVHVAMRYDYNADGSNLSNENMATSIPIYVSGAVPTFRFPVLGKPLLDPRKSGESPTTWQPDTLYSFANYIVDQNSDVEYETNGPGGSFESGPGPNPPNFAGPGFPTQDNQAGWLNGGPIQAGGWPGPEQNIRYPYTFRDPNGNLQSLAETACGGSPLEFSTGPTEPTWDTNPGQYTGDGATLTEQDGIVSTTVPNAGSGGIDGTYQVFPIQPGGGDPGPATLTVVVSGGKIFSCVITVPGFGYVGVGQSFEVINGASIISPPSGFPNGASIMATIGVVNENQGPVIGVLSIAVPTPGSGFSAQPISFPVYDSFEPQNPAYAAMATAYMRVGGGVAAPYNYQIDHVVVTSPGATYTGSTFSIQIPEQIVGGTPATLVATLGNVGGGGGGTGQNPQVWLCLGVPTGGSYATNLSNPALIIYDYLLDTEYGMSADPASIDLESIMAAANLCEETVVICVASNNGKVTENLYDCDGVFDEGTPRGDILKALVACCAGTLVPPGDMWHLFAGAYSPPTATLTDADVRDAIKFDFRRSRRDICNGVKGTFLPKFLPTNQTEGQPVAWRPTDFPAYQANGLQGHPDYLFSEDGGEIIWKDIKVGFCTSIYQVQRLAKIVLMLLRFQVSGVLSCKLTAFPIMAGDTIIFTHARWAALPNPPPTIFFVTKATIVVESKNGAPAIGMDLTLQQTDPSIYQFAAPTIPFAQPWQQGMGEYSGYETLGVL